MHGTDAARETTRAGKCSMCMHFHFNIWKQRVLGSGECWSMIQHLHIQQKLCVKGPGGVNGLEVILQSEVGEFSVKLFVRRGKELSKEEERNYQKVESTSWWTPAFPCLYSGYFSFSYFCLTAFICTVLDLILLILDIGEEFSSLWIREFKCVDTEHWALKLMHLITCNRGLSKPMYHQSISSWQPHHPSLTSSKPRPHSFFSKNHTDLILLIRFLVIFLAEIRTYLYISIITRILWALFFRLPSSFSFQCWLTWRWNDGVSSRSGSLMSTSSSGHSATMGRSALHWLLQQTANWSVVAEWVQAFFHMISIDFICYFSRMEAAGTDTCTVHTVYPSTQTVLQPVKLYWLKPGSDEAVCCARCEIVLVKNMTPTCLLFE